MQKELQLVLEPKIAHDIESNFKLIANILKFSEDRITKVEVLRQSIDARKRQVKINVKLNIYIDEEAGQETIDISYPNVLEKPSVIVVGAGPAGLFAALQLIQEGFKPIVLERGKKVNERKKDIALINRNKDIDPNSNYAFGEGGAGAFSDGKLYTRSKKRGNIKNIINILIAHGADSNILKEAHPHIGSDKLPIIIKNIRETIINAGGEIYFQHHVNDFIIENNTVRGVRSNQKTFKGLAVIVATGHSAKDIYYLLNKKDIALESKDFAMGVRVEHHQKQIDSMQYHCDIRSDYLPAASYSLVQQVDERGVYSFCMCPGGFIVPAASNTQEIVVNGMSPSLRNSPFANSGMVVQIKQDDLIKYKKWGVLAGLKFQEEYEQLAFKNGGGQQIAPAQRLLDFINNKLSSDLPSTSYIPGVMSSPMHLWIPKNIRLRLQKGFEKFGQKMKGYLSNEAIIIGVESRTSSPIRIPRNKNTMEHIEIENFYPCGEGAGYAGGIVSAALDGESVAKQIGSKQSLVS